MSNRPPSRAAPRGHGIYLRMLDSLPGPCAEGLRAIATSKRRVRRTARLSSRRLRRRLARLHRRAAARFRRWFLNGGLRRFAPGGAEGAPAKPGLAEKVWRSRVFRILVPPIVQLPGAGPTLAVDARGVTTGELVRRLDRFDRRTIFLVDDPDIAPLRVRGVFYDYAPTTVEVSARERLWWTVVAFGVDRVTTFEESMSGARLVDPGEAVESATSDRR